MSYSKIKFSQQIEEFDEDKLDEIMENITLKPPRSAYTFYCKEQFEKYKKDTEKSNFILFSKDCGPKWAKLNDEEKKIYIKKYEEEKNKYQYELEIVRHYLFKDYNDVIQCSITPYQLFLNEKMIEGFENNLDPNDVKNSASIQWKSMTRKEKKIYTQKKEENDNFFEKVKKLKKVNGISIFIQKVIETAKNKNEPIPNLEEIKYSWSILPISMKNKFKKYAESINEEREKLNDIYELVNGLKPKLPSGSYKLFLQEKLKEKRINDFNEGKKLWDELNDDEKEKYLKKAHRLKLAYQYKKMIYNKKIKKFLPKKPSSAFHIYLKENPRKTKSFKEKYDEYCNLSKEKKNEYEEKYRLKKKQYNEEMKKFKNCVFDMPKAPLNEYYLYRKERYSELKKNKNLNSNEIKEIIGKEWKENEEIKLKYKKIAEENRKRFKKELSEFNKLGYYTKNNSEYFSDDEESDENKEKINKRTNKKRNISTNKKKKSYLTETKRSKSKSIKKDGKSQRKKK